MPAYNVEAYLPRAIATIPSFVGTLIVVDDASQDGTARCAREASRPVVLLEHQRNRGVGAAIASGYAEALRRGVDVVCVMAGDGQMDPADLPALLDPLVEERADYAKGNRFAHREVWRAMPATRLFGNVVLSLLTKLSSGYWRSFDSQCGYTAITAPALAAIDGRLFARYGYPNDLLARLRAVDACVVDVPVRPVYDGQASGIRPWTVLYPMLFVLGRSFFWRLWKQRLAPLLGRPSLRLLPPHERGDALLPEAPRLPAPPR